ncbi:tumor necrosis factor receptor superfamily member 5 [Echeneis naucrates]|uniref:Tumor necrosis factor receptor superfamily member 5-like n=1 Tax=Echeneis naucrates TaxID=173247 RepID=A0A665UN16_ECHNA|nr:tumor necrosis factor receptor superfamily member 5-like [Echeneis naucrates]
MKMMMMMKILLIICTLTAVTAAEFHCDPQTQYGREGQCCKKCNPGTYMVKMSCELPDCKECGENHYQDDFTTDAECKPQPFCDRNKNFQPAVSHNKRKRTTCLCLLGHHCSSEACITCVPHTSCEPGHWSRRVGNSTHDTICEKCPVGWFSDKTSWNSSCLKHTKCEGEYQIRLSGTETSDNVCEKIQREHNVAIIIFAVLAAVVLIAICVAFVCREGARRSIKDCINSCHRETWEPQRDTIVPMTPEDDAEIQPMFDQTVVSQEEASSRTPEENEDELNGEMSVGPHRTENGNYVGQEMGKTETVPREESCTQSHSGTENSLNSTF